LIRISKSLSSRRPGRDGRVAGASRDSGNGRVRDGVAWKDIVLKAYVKASSLVGGVNRLGVQDFADCAYSSTTDWDESCFDTWKQLGNSGNTLAWYSTAIVTSSHRSGTKVRSMVSVEIGTVYIYNARVTYKYATLGY
jgi:hypothetical protein